MPYQVLLTEDAEADLVDLFDFIVDHDSLEKAEYVLDTIEQQILALSEQHQRGVRPKELSPLGIKEFR